MKQKKPSKIVKPKRRTTKRQITKRRPKRKSAGRPREVYLAIRKLLDTTHHIQARAAEVEHSLAVLRGQERGKALKELLSALRNSPDGDLLRFDSGLDEGGTNRLPAIIEALVEAFAIEPLHEIGAQIPVRHGKIPDELELDRALSEEVGECIAAEVVSPGWQYQKQTLLRPVVRPLFRTTA